MNFFNKILTNGIFWDKLGVENLLLIVTGVLYFVLFLLKRQEGHYHRLYLYCWNGIFFIGYGLAFDIFRYRWFRYHYFQWFKNVLAWRIVIIGVLLVPIYILLVKDITAIIKTRLEDTHGVDHRI